MADNTPKKLAKLASNMNNAGLAVIASSSLSLFGVPVGIITGILVSYYALEAPLKNFIVLMVIALVPSIIALFVIEDELSLHIFTQMTSFIVALGLISYLLREFSSWSVVLQAVGIIGACVIIGIYIAYPDIDAWWLERLKSFFTNSELNQVDESLEIYAKYATGMQVMSLSFSALLNLLFARYWQACVYNKKSKVRQECLQMQLSGVMVVFISFLALCSFLKFPWALDALIVSLLPAFFAGAALFHVLTEKNVRKSNRIFVLILFYMMNLIAFPFVPLFVAIVGLVDYAMQLRARFGLVIK